MFSPNTLEACIDEQLDEQECEELAEDVEAAPGATSEIIENWRVKKKSNRTYEKQCYSCSEITTYQAKERPELCPVCGARYWDKPFDERELFLLQDKYYESGRDKKIAALMYLKIKEYAENLIKHRAKTTKSFKKSFIEEKSADAACTLVEHYLKKETYRVHTSFGQNLNWILNGVLYKDQDNDGELSLNSTCPSGEGQELLENLGRIGLAHEYERFMTHDSHTEAHSTGPCSRELSTVLEQIRQSIQHNQHTGSSLGYLLVFRHKLSRQRKGFVEAFYRSFGYEHRDNFEKAELVIMRFLKETR